MGGLKDHYCFIHLPKSAGTSLIQFMQAALGEPNVLHVHTPGAHMNAPLEYLITRYRGLIGHFEVSHLSSWMFENVFMFTFLRDPVDRVLSNYYFYRNVHHERQVFEMMRAQQLDIKSLLSQCDLSRPTVWSNWQSFALSGLEYSAFAPGTVLEPAKRTLERLDFVGLYERLRPDMKRLCEICGWDPTIPLPVANVTPNRKTQTDLDQETLELIHQLNRDDIELYNYAKNIPSKSAPRAKGPSVTTLPPAFFARRERGTKEIIIREVLVRGSRSRSDEVEQGDELEIRIAGESTIDCPNVVTGIKITDTLGFEIYGTNTLLIDEVVTVKPAQKFCVVFSFILNLAPGKYDLTVAFHSEDDREFHRLDNHSVFQCLPSVKRTFSGITDLKAEVKVTAQTSGESEDTLRNSNTPFS